jgi:hypothetical protein
MLSNITTTTTTVVAIPLMKTRYPCIISKKPKSETNDDNLDKKHLDSEYFIVIVKKPYT